MVLLYNHHPRSKFDAYYEYKIVDICGHEYVITRNRRQNIEEARLSSQTQPQKDRRKTGTPHLPKSYSIPDIIPMMTNTQPNMIKNQIEKRDAQPRILRRSSRIRSKPKRFGEQEQ